MPGQRPLGFAIVGCGMIARFHARALQDIPDTRLVALISRTPANAQALLEATQLQANIYPELSEALENPDVDVVIVTTPSGAHLDPAIAAAQAGKHVVVEKPLEITTARCDQIIRSCEKNRVKLCTIFPSRFSDANLTLKTAIEEGRFGRLTLGETACKWWRTQAYYDKGGWKGTLALDGGGALMNQAIHNVDLLLWMIGEPREVVGFTATLAHERIEVEDTAVACVRFASGALGVIQATTSVWPGLPKTIAIHGNRGTAIIEQDDLLRWEFEPAAPQDDDIRQRFAQKIQASGGASDPAAISHLGHARQLADFVEAIRLDRPPAVDGREGRKAVAVIEAIYRSVREGKTVPLS